MENNIIEFLSHRAVICLAQEGHGSSAEYGKYEYNNFDIKEFT